MILKLPRDIKLLSSRQYVVKEEASLGMKESQNGITLFDSNGRPVAQVQHHGKSSTTVAVVGCGCLEIVREGHSARFELPSFAEKQSADMPKFSFNEFDFFGNTETAEFAVYRRKEGKDKPQLLVQATPDRTDKNLFTAYVPYTEHGTLAVAVCMGLIG